MCRSTFGFKIYFLFSRPDIMIIFCQQLCHGLQKKKDSWRSVIGTMRSQSGRLCLVMCVCLVVHVQRTCKSLDSVTLLISMGLGLKAAVPSKESCWIRQTNTSQFARFYAGWCEWKCQCWSVLGWPVISFWTCCGDWQGPPLWSFQCSSPMLAWSSETLLPASSTPPYPVQRGNTG